MFRCSHPLEFRGKKLKKLRKSCGKVAEKLRDLLSEFCWLFISWTLDIGQNLSYPFDMSENWTKEVQTSPLLLNQIANFVTVNSEKTLNSHQITKNILQIGKSCGKVAKRCGKLQKDAESCEKMRKVAESCGIVKLAKVAISATSATAWNSRGCDIRKILGILHGSVRWRHYSKWCSLNVTP